MKPKAIRKKSEKDCLKLLKEKEERLAEIRFSGANTKSKNTKEAFNLRKDIARIKTILKENKQQNHEE